ncbi:hypothetical protein ACFY15_07535 [Streptomyces sp. NPDC001373]|uniref:hypothetical protein n=1 Tax=Streptomyces sp. NPDC001373 TaxID=3364565 RepID=UPI00369A5118
MNNNLSTLGKGSRAMIRRHIADAEQATREAMFTGDPAASSAHQSIVSALEIVDALLFPADGCAGPDCVHPVQDKGFGRPALYCGQRCRDRASYRARKQRAAQREG